MDAVGKSNRIGIFFKESLENFVGLLFKVCYNELIRSILSMSGGGMVG